ncbi:hypothetical protein F4780DRAFT_775199 [Xylariomycetidae sp. FL0641]|nr:hypothetical protein F4780DRAFT_775199 [Xylariomycetidae sp. FL0641]
MPVRIPKARGTELATFGVAGVGAFAPFYFLLPGAEERLASQTARWAPRWERNVGYLAAPAERLAHRVEPRAERLAHRLDDRLPLARVALGVDRRIKNGIDRAERWHRH